MDPACGESFPSGQCRRSAAPWDDKVPSLDQNSFLCIRNSNNPGTKAGIPRVDTAPQGVETPQSCLIGAHGRCSAAPGDDKTHLRVRNPSEYVQLQPFGDKNGHPRVDTAPHGGPYISVQSGTGTSLHTASITDPYQVYTYILLWATQG